MSLQNLQVRLGDSKMHIEDFNVSEECRSELKRVGFITVEDVVEFLEEQAKGQAMIRAGWLKCFDEITKQLKVLNLWSKTLEQTWQSNE